MPLNVAALQADLAPLSRRSFIKTGVAVGVGLTTLTTLGCSAPSSSDFNISKEDSDVLAKLIAVMLPDTQGFFPAKDIPMLENISHLLGLLPAEIQEDLSTAIQLFQYGSLILGWHLSRFTQLGEAEAVDYVNAWQSGNQLQRGIVSAFKKLVYTAYWQDERTWSAVSFDGPVSDKWGLEKLGNAPLPA